MKRPIVVIVIGALVAAIAPSAQGKAPLKVPSVVLSQADVHSDDCSLVSGDQAPQVVTKLKANKQAVTRLTKQQVYGAADPTDQVSVSEKSIVKTTLAKKGGSFSSLDLKGTSTVSFDAALGSEDTACSDIKGGFETVVTTAVTVRGKGVLTISARGLGSKRVSSLIYAVGPKNRNLFSATQGSDTATIQIPTSGTTTWVFSARVDSPFAFGRGSSQTTTSIVTAHFVKRGKK